MHRNVVTDQKERLRELLLAMPKTEIHVHLEGMASVDTIWRLIRENKVEIPDVGSEEDIRRRFRVGSLPEFIDLFINVIQNSFRKEADISLLMDDARDYLVRNNVEYAEVHFAPSMFLRNGHDFATMMKILDRGARELKDKHGLEVRFIIDLSRSFGVKNAAKNLDLTLEHMIPSIVGVGLGGQESSGPARKFVEVFDRAREAGMRVVAHAGESVGPESVRDAIDLLHAERIGHGISSILDRDLMDDLRDRAIPLEVCPSSNLFTGHYATTLKEHPIRAFVDHGMFITVNTDDPSIFGVELIDEYLNLISEGIFSATEILGLVRNGYFATFQDRERQQAMWDRARKAARSAGFDVSD